MVISFDMLDEMLKEGCTCEYFWTEGDPLTLEEFNKLAHNSQLCARKSFDLLDSESEIRERFQEQFKEIMYNNKERQNYGIKKGTTYKTYMEEFRKLNDNIDNVKDYIVDQPLQDWSQGDNKEEQKNKFMRLY